MILAASVGLLTRHGLLKPDEGVKKAGKSSCSPYVATVTPCVSCSNIHVSSSHKDRDAQEIENRPGTPGFGRCPGWTWLQQRQQRQESSLILLNRQRRPRLFDETGCLHQWMSQNVHNTLRSLISPPRCTPPSPPVAKTYVKIVSNL